jgi:quinol-cytochrome oxidoreductase complex cytochrome b subunit
MDKPRINYWIDTLMLVAVAVTAITGLILFIILPSGRRSGWVEFSDIIKGTWRDIHAWAGLVFITLAVVHLILHWKWIVAMTKNLFVKNK